MQIQNKKETENKLNQCFSWIKSIENPLLKNCSDINDLRDGKVFLELIKYYFNNNKENQNYFSLLNRANNAENPFERMNIIFHAISKIANNNKIKSRIESFHNNINAFLKNDNLIKELFIFIIYHLFRKNKNNNRISQITRQENMNINQKRNKNHSYSQGDSRKNSLNTGDNKYKRKIINYYSVNNENKHSKKERNNFLYYINNKNENIINIDNIMNFRFTNGINNLTTQNNNIKNNHITKEIKSYVTKPKIIKYQSKYFNNYIKEDKNNNKNIRNTKSKINFNDLKNFIKNEENKINATIAKIKESINSKYISNKNHIYKPVNYNQKRNMNDDEEEENKLISESEDKNLFKKELENEKYSYEKNDMVLFHKNRNLSANNFSEKNNIYKFLKLSKNRNNINNIDNEKLIEEEKLEEHTDNIDKLLENDRPKNKKKIFYSRNFRRNKNTKINEQQLLNDKIDLFREKEIKRQNSYAINEVNNIKEFYKFNENNNNKNIRSYSHFEYKNPKKIIDKNNNENEKEIIFKWLIEIKVIKPGETDLINLPQLISDGKLLCEIINRCENKDNQIEEISKEISIKENALTNIQKALEFLNKIDNFPKRNINDYESIFEIDTDIIWGLLFDLYIYYSNKVDIKNNFQEEYDETISNNNNNSNINKKKENFPSKRIKKNFSEISDLNFNNNIKIKNMSNNNNSNIKNILFKNIPEEKNDSENDNEEDDSENFEYNSNLNSNYLKYINNRETIKKNNSSNNIYKPNKNDYINSGKINDKRNNYFHYVNALQNYFDQEKNSQIINLKNENYKGQSEKASGYSYKKYEPLYFNKKNKNLYFDYSNNILPNEDKKIKYSHNQINRKYYNTDCYNNENK